MDSAIGWIGEASEWGGRTGAAAPDGTVDIVGRAYAVYGSAILGHLRAITRDPEAAADLTQEAFLRLHVEVVAGRAPDDVRAWLYRVATNLATSRGRRSQVAARHAPALRENEEARSTEDLVLDRERDDGLRLALARLPARDRDLLLLAAAGLTGPELADQLGRTQLATRTLLCRARSKLRQLVVAADGAIT
jgi:RNA polymerase sigma-70 factor (ECF subfamily)